MRIISSCILLFLFTLQLTSAVRNDAVEVRKSITRDGSDFVVTIQYKSLVDPSKITDFQIIDSFPIQFSLKSGQIVLQPNKVTKEGNENVYRLALNMNNKFYLEEQVFEVELPGAEIAYKLDNQQQTIVTEGATVTIDLGQLLIPRGGWLIPNVFTSSLVVGFVVLALPVLAALSLIPSAHQRALNRKKK